jgi:hypothetical protein
VNSERQTCHPDGSERSWFTNSKACVLRAGSADGFEAISIAFATYLDSILLGSSRPVESSLLLEYIDIGQVTEGHARGRVVGWPFFQFSPTFVKTDSKATGVGMRLLTCSSIFDQPGLPSES